MDDLEALLKISKAKMLKLVCYELKGQLVLVHIRGDLNVSMHKLAYRLGLNPFEAEEHLQMASSELLAEHGIVPGFGGLYGARDVPKMIVVFDESVHDMHDCVVGGNRVDYHYIHYDYARDSREHLKAIMFADVAQLSEMPQDGVLVEGVLLQGNLPLMGADGKQEPCQMYCLRLRCLEILQATQNHRFMAVYCAQQVPAKCAEQYAAAQRFLAAVDTQRYYMVLDDRPKVTLGKKLETARSGVYCMILVLNKNMGADEADGYVWDAAAGDYVERRIRLDELRRAADSPPHG